MTSFVNFFWVVWIMRLKRAIVFRGRSKVGGQNKHSFIHSSFILVYVLFILLCHSFCVVHICMYYYIVHTTRLKKKVGKSQKVLSLSNSQVQTTVISRKYVPILSTQAHSRLSETTHHKCYFKLYYSKFNPQWTFLIVHLQPQVLLKWELFKKEIQQFDFNHSGRGLDPQWYEEADQGVQGVPSKDLILTCAPPDLQTSRRLW